MGYGDRFFLSPQASEEQKQRGLRLLNQVEGYGPRRKEPLYLFLERVPYRTVGECVGWSIQLMDEEFATQHTWVCVPGSGGKAHRKNSIYLYKARAPVKTTDGKPVETGGEESFLLEDPFTFGLSYRYHKAIVEALETEGALGVVLIPREGQDLYRVRGAEVFFELPRAEI